LTRAWVDFSPMTVRLKVRSLAKINLDLRVLNKRADGYHELRTIFQTVSLDDTIEMEYQPGRTHIDINSNFNIPDNLVVRAAHSVLESTGRTGRLGFVLQKRIPLGGGLGGGSSNAAAVLLALPWLLRKWVRFEKLMELAAELGSDVPFFLMGGTAVGLGRGTELYPLPDILSLPAILITPGIHVSTPDAYGELDRQLTGAPPSHIINDFQGVAQRIAGGSPAEKWEPANDFESVVFRQHPQLKSIKGRLLRGGARPALMSGSGSTLFGIFSDRVIRDRAVRSFRQDFAKDQVFPVTMVSRSRYQKLWQRQLAVPVGNKLWPWPPQEYKP
jgi:4-diphosphocytidyl-2-C-methyl-D-erythritol kinase